MINKLRIERINMQTIAFLNLLEGYSSSSDDIINIYDKAILHLGEPIKSIFAEFVIDIRLMADSDYAYKKLYKKLEGTRLIDLVKSLRICSIKESDYRNVIIDARESFNEYMKSKRIRKSIVSSAKVDIAGLIIAAFVATNMLNSFLSNSVLDILTSSVIGMAIIIYWIVSMIIIVIFMLGEG